MSKPVMRAPSPASATATARPWPWAAPVMNATFPANSFPTRRSFQGLAFAVIVQISVQLHLEHIIDDVGGDHETGKRGQCHDLLGPEEAFQFLIKVLWHTVPRLCHGPSKCNEQFSFIIQFEFIRIFSPVHEDPAHESG